MRKLCLNVYALMVCMLLVPLTVLVSLIWIDGWMGGWMEGWVAVLQVVFTFIYFKPSVGYTATRQKGSICAQCIIHRSLLPIPSFSLHLLFTVTSCVE